MSRKLFANDNHKLITAFVVAFLWWQCATTSAHAAPPAPGPVPARPAAPPLLPGQVGGNFEQAMQFANEALFKHQDQMAVENYQCATKFKPDSPDAHLGLGMALY